MFQHLVREPKPRPRSHDEVTIRAMYPIAAIILMPILRIQ